MRFSTANAQDSVLPTFVKFKFIVLLFYSFLSSMSNPPFFGADFLSQQIYLGL